MTNSAQTKLNEITKEIGNHYGTDFTILIEVIDRYINYYHNTENQKKEILCAYDDFDINSTSCGIENVLQTIKNNVETEDRCASSINNDMFDFMMLKKFIADLGVVIALNEPERITQREKYLQENIAVFEPNDNLLNEN